jgi:predicted ATPase/class 3 adenylate cyclase
MDLPLEVPTTWPSGFVTFVLTDIEGSTRLLRRLGGRYDEVIVQHNSLLRHSWEQHGGAHVSDRGDSCLAAFGDASSALEACAEAQRQLATARWPPDGRPKVRMGVHAGVASPRRGDYVALAVHQAARVAAAAHGGQVLASEVVATEIGALPDLALTPVGKYRLRDFDEPVRLHCLRGIGLDVQFPAVRAVPVDGHNLTTPSTSLVGRDGEVAALVPRLQAGRLVTLAGPGGVGKTRLALAIGRAAAERWEDGVWFVDLSPVQDPRLIGITAAGALGVTIGGGADGWVATLEHLRTQRALVLVDNCEHLASDVAGMMTELLSTCPGSGVLATSREPLGIAGEHVFRVNPLSLPLSGTSVDTAIVIPSVQLFVERAQSVMPDFALDATNLQTVVELCRRLDGLPLALELAAAQTSVVGVHDLLEGLDDEFQVLGNRQRDVPDRQRTMNAAVDWSLRLLTPEERAVLTRLSVLRGGFTLAAAVVGGDDVEGCDVPDVVWSLVDKSLVVVDLAANDTRYRLLETVRAQLRRLLDEEHATVPTALRLTDWWLDRVGPWHRTDRVRSGEIEVELDNLRALVPLIAEHAEERAQQLVCSIGRHYYAVHASRDSIAELTRYATELAVVTPARVSMLATLAMMHVHQGDVDTARRVLSTAERECRVVGPPPWDEVAVERARGEVSLRSGDHQAAAELARQTLAGDLTLSARARMLNLLAIASYFSGDVLRAAAAFSEELDVARQLGDEHLIVVAEGNVAELAMRTGDAVSAARHQRASLDLALALGRPVGVALAFIVAARLTAPTDPGVAGQLHAKAEAILDETDYRLYDDDLRASAAMLDDVRQRLGEVYFARSREDGRGMSMLDAVTLAQDAFGRVTA